MVATTTATAATAGTAGTTGAAAGATTGAITAGTTGATTGGFGSWLHSILFGEAAKTATLKTGEVIATEATKGLIGASGEYSTKSLLANALTGASATSAVMGGVNMGRQMKAAEKQTEVQYGQEKLKATQKSNLIRETMLKDVASANASYAKRGITNSGSPEQVIREGINQANQDIGVVATDSQLTGLQLKSQGYQYKKSAPFSLLSGFANGAGIVGNRILRK